MTLSMTVHFLRRCNRCCALCEIFRSFRFSRFRFECEKKMKVSDCNSISFYSNFFLSVGVKIMNDFFRVYYALTHRRDVPCFPFFLMGESHNFAYLNKKICVTKFHHSDRHTLSKRLTVNGDEKRVTSLCQPFTFFRTENIIISKILQLPVGHDIKIYVNIYFLFSYLTEFFISRFYGISDIMNR